MCEYVCNLPAPGLRTVFAVLATARVSSLQPSILTLSINAALGAVAVAAVGVMGVFHMALYVAEHSGRCSHEACLPAWRVAWHASSLRCNCAT